MIVINIEDYQYQGGCYKIVLGTFAPETFLVFEHSENDALDALADWLKREQVFLGLWEQTNETTDWDDPDLAVYGNESDVIFDNVFIRQAHPRVYLKVTLADKSYEEMIEEF